MNQRLIQVDPWSLAALQIEMYFDQTLASHGTGSIWKLNGKTYLVTNWHNFSGKHRETGEHISKTNCEPNMVRVFFHKSGAAGQWTSCDVQLLNDGNQVWIDHPRKTAMIDLAAIEIQLPEDAELYFPAELHSTDLITEVGAELFVVGYPFKIETVGLPVWKRGSLAGELMVAQLSETGRFLIDTATRQGMSGSLVVRKQTGSWVDERGNSMGGQTGASYRFMGIYSGRLGANKDGDAQLGIVWPTRLVHELLNSISD
jgi:hypothetical protein